MKIYQVYVCQNDYGSNPCRHFGKPIHSWLTPEDCNRFMAKGLLCSSCHRPLKWLRAQQFLGTHNRPFDAA